MGRKKQKPIEEPQPLKWLSEVTSDLLHQEVRFITLLTQGVDPADACYSAGLAHRDTARSALHFLGKESIRKALRKIIPYVPDPRISLKLASLFAAEYLVNSLIDETKEIDKERAKIAKDVLDRAGYGAVTKSEVNSKSFKQILTEIKKRGVGKGSAADTIDAADTIKTQMSEVHTVVGTAEASLSSRQAIGYDNGVTVTDVQYDTLASDTDVSSVGVPLLPEYSPENIPDDTLGDSDE